ncbi:kinase-like domain-containing protein [Lasiosphaeria ovina]|uniref:mitogen-activated protein kinase kinase n=1 Tax=Lasiosphaeria ovina TaxID=92902 RepID=A0AAE0JTP9_9PEZI|nr:kinase-like domain-containing protein [Lasiosphaeria ovina]
MPLFGLARILLGGVIVDVVLGPLGGDARAEPPPHAQGMRMSTREAGAGNQTRRGQLPRYFKFGRALRDQLAAAKSLRPPNFVRKASLEPNPTRPTSSRRAQPRPSVVSVMFRILNSRQDDRYQSIKYLGKGGYGTVHQVKRLRDGKIMACKVVETGLNNLSVAYALREFNTLSKVSGGSNITEISECVITPATGTVRLYMKYYGGGDLQQFISSMQATGTSVSGPIIIMLSSFVAHGVKTCHSQNILHRDIKPSNILLDSGLSLEDYRSQRRAYINKLTNSQGGRNIFNIPVNPYRLSGLSVDIDQY